MTVALTLPSASFFLGPGTAAAIYEMRPLSPLPLTKGTRGEVTVVDEVSTLLPVGTRSLSDSAAPPMESDKGPSSTRDHDRVLSRATATKL